MISVPCATILTRCPASWQRIVQCPWSPQLLGLLEFALREDLLTRVLALRLADPHGSAQAEAGAVVGTASQQEVSASV